MFISNCSRCHLSLKLTGFVLNVSKSYISFEPNTFYYFLLNLVTQRYFSLFTHLIILFS
ncbi:hypothetical protein Hanom_Chr08g00695491 [Helianthus anomalus]